MSLALWGSPDKCLWLCQEDYDRWESAYKSQQQGMTDASGGTVIKIVGWEVWLQDQSRQDFEDGKGLQPA